MILNKKKKKYICIFVIKEQGNYNVIKKKRFNPSNNKIKLRKQMFILKVRYPTYVKGIKLFYFIDVKTGTQISFRKFTKITESHSLINLMLGEGVIEELVNGLGEKTNVFNTIVFVLGVVIGALGGFITAGYV